MTTLSFSALKTHRYISFTTYNKNGKKVALPVWFVVEDAAIYVWTSKQSFKVKRLLNNPNCEIAPCNASGKKILGPSIKGTATFLEGAEMERYARLIQKRYGWQHAVIRLFRILRTLFREAEEQAVIRIR